MNAFPDIARLPDKLIAVTDGATIALQLSAQGVWQGGGVVVQTTVVTARQDENPTSDKRLHLSLQSEVPVRSLRLHWRGEFPPSTRFLGDAWERGYGDLEWRGLVLERAMPWYFLACAADETLGYGVQTGAGALCCWRANANGIVLCLDVKSGGIGVELGERTLEVATICSVRGQDSFTTSQALCRALCERPRLPQQPVYGGNDWYYAYGANSRETVLRDAATLSELAPAGDNRPFMVIDDGWQECRHPWNGGPWNRASPQFGDMESVAGAMKQRGVRPGLWFRPLLSSLNVPHSWRFSARAQPAPEGLPLDPSVPEVLQLVADDVRRFREWGFELVKHDFSTFDIFWKWGFSFGDDPAHEEGSDSGWRFKDRSRTSAEIIRSLYQTMRQAGEEMLLLGCNTIGHLGAGFFEIQRTGDDTSGREWERTRKMGINTLAFRMAQHNAFFAVDADCVGLTRQIPWNLNRQWLDLLARSGTPLFVSAAPDALDSEQKTALRQAFARAATVQTPAQPLDWMDSTCPALWRHEDETRSYNWFDGAP